MKNKTTTTTMYYMFMFTFVWLMYLTWSTSSNASYASDLNGHRQMMGETIDMVHHRVLKMETRMVEETIARKEAMMSFQAAFRMNREVFGSHAIFTWNGEAYSTSWKEETDNN